MTPSSRQEDRRARQTIVLDQYKLVREHIALLVQDRIANNRLLLAISTAILGGEGLVVKDVISASASSLSLVATALLFLAAFAGAGLSFIWKRWNLSYKTSLRIRYDLLREIELSLPMQPFARELELRREYSYVNVSDVIAELATMFFLVFSFQLPFLAYFIAVKYGG
jgi:hypothetical protein